MSLHVVRHRRVVGEVDVDLAGEERRHGIRVLVEQPEDDRLAPLLRQHLVLGGERVLLCAGQYDHIALRQQEAVHCGI